MSEVLSSIQLPPTFTARPPTMDDVQIVVDLYNVINMHLLGKETDTVEDLTREWEDPDWDVKDSALLVFDQNERLVAFAEVGHPRELPVRPFIGVELHPEHEDGELGDSLLAWAENTAQRVLGMTPETAKVTFVTDMLPSHSKHRALFERHGYSTWGQQWEKMLIEMSEEPAPVVFPPGIQIVTATDYKDFRAIYDARQASFKDHRGYVERDPEKGFKTWQHWALGDPKHDPSLWFIAMDGDTIAGLNLCRPEASDAEDEGYVGLLGILADYRGRGLGKALLKHSFREFWLRGKRKVSLWVDGSSITGANHLYTGVGMHVDRAYITYEKVVRDGEELSRQ